MSPNVGTIVLAGNAEQQPWLIGQNKRIETQLTALPSPLPQPALTPAPGLTSVYAASFGTLARHTTYGVRATQVISFPCGPAVPGHTLKLGSFTTR